jgi:signal transduction histidine kinase
MTKMPTKKPGFPPIPKKYLKVSTLENMLKILSTRLLDPASQGERRRLMEQAMAITQEALTMVKDSHEMKNEVNVLKGRITWRAMRIAAWTMELDKEMKALDSETDPTRLRSILQAIKSQSMEWFQDTERSRAIEEEAIQKLSHRLKSWAEYGRLISENLQGKIPVEAIDLGQAARASVERWRAHAEKKKLDLALQAEKDLIVRGDRGLVEQVIENLIDNAIKATTRGKVEVLCRPETAGILLEVRDTGHGIPQEDLVRLFEKPFYQNRIPRAHETNTGVGLYLVSQYVRSLGGQVWAESRMGKGSSFFVQLPRYNQDRPKASL